MMQVTHYSIAPLQQEVRVVEDSCGAVHCMVGCGGGGGNYSTSLHHISFLFRFAPRETLHFHPAIHHINAASNSV